MSNANNLQTTSLEDGLSILRPVLPLEDVQSSVRDWPERLQAVFEAEDPDPEAEVESEQELQARTLCDDLDDGDTHIVTREDLDLPRTREPDAADPPGTPQSLSRLPKPRKVVYVVVLEDFIWSGSSWERGLTMCSERILSRREANYFAAAAFLQFASMIDRVWTGPRPNPVNLADEYPEACGVDPHGCVYMTWHDWSGDVRIKVAVERWELS